MSYVYTFAGDYASPSLMCRIIRKLVKSSLFHLFSADRYKHFYIWYYHLWSFVLQRAIQYLLPSGLFEKKARPMLKVGICMIWICGVR